MDMSEFTKPRSDQKNADDFLSGPRTIVITKMSLTEAVDQPVAVFFEGDDGKPYKPCLSMRRIMLAAWGKDAAKYVGRSMTLFRDPNAMFKGEKVGGIRISHVSHIDHPVSLALTVTRGKRVLYTVLPLAETQKSTGSLAADDGERVIFTGAVGPIEYREEAARPGHKPEYVLTAKSLAAINAKARQPAVDPAHGDVFDEKGNDDPSPGTTGSGGRAPTTTAWDAGEVEKTDRFRIPLTNPDGGEIRFFSAVSAWGSALEYLVDTSDWHAVWTDKDNSETYAALVSAATNPRTIGYLKSIADYVDAARKAEQLEKGE